MGRDDFLQLLVAQMRHQDPMAPMDGQEFAAQLAQFSGVEQLMAIRDAVGASGASTDDLRHILSTSLAADMMGKDVLLVDGNFEVGPEAGGSLDVEVGVPGGSAKLVVRDETGKIVREVDAGTLLAGRQKVSLAALDLPEGRYHASIAVTGSAGQPVEAAIYGRSRVTGVQFGANGIQLTTSSGTVVPLGEVVEIISDSAV